MTTTPYERIWITVRYACGHYAARAVFRTPETENDSRSQGDYRYCEICLELEQQAEERRAALPEPENYTIRYMVGGHPMCVELDKHGYWRGRRYEDGKKISKYFGRTDPRPSLEEVID